MLVRTKKIDDIIQKISLLHYYIRSNSKLLRVDINRDCEDFFCELLNLVFDYNLVNLNAENSNHPGVDLGDKNNRIAFQVTASNTRSKIEATILTFEKHKLYKHYNDLVVLILNEKKDYKKDFNNHEEKYRLAIIDIYDLLGIISKLQNQKLDVITSFIAENLDSCLDSLTKGKFYKKSKEVLLFKHGRTYIEDYCGNELGDKESNFTIVELTKFASKLKELSRQSRELVCHIIERRVDTKRHTIYFDPVEVRDQLGVTNREIREQIDILIKRNFVNEDTGLEYYELYPKGFDWNVFYDIAIYCEKYNKSLYDLIVNLDFSLLD